MTRIQLNVLAVFCATVMASACAKRAVSIPASPPPVAEAVPAPPPPPPPPPPVATVAPLSDDDLFARKSLAELSAERPLGVAYFDLDSSAIRDDARSGLQRNADWMRRWPSTRIAVEGHCDERGSSEYNLALGERRAAAVKDYLVSLGVTADRLAVVSKGKEAPECSVSAEDCWQQNRRGVPVITAK